VTLPGITFDGRLELHGAKRRAELITYEGAHTGSDAILYLPQDGVVFTSDLLFVGNHPYLADGDPFKLLETLHALSQLDAATFVPGHGPVGSREDLFLMIEYVEHCLAAARLIVQEGGDYEERVKQLPAAEKFQGWQLSGFYPTNILFLCRRLSAQVG
jgi:glyoxylase-like metal-dependent hydrolase (beta-lactamase superfamily II)